MYTNDLQLSNMNSEEGNEVDGTNGKWTIQEGEEDILKSCPLRKPFVYAIVFLELPQPRKRKDYVSNPSFHRDKLA